MSFIDCVYDKNNKPINAVYDHLHNRTKIKLNDYSLLSGNNIYMKLFLNNNSFTYLYSTISFI